MSFDNRKTTPRLHQAITTIVESFIADLNVSMPCEVISYNYDKNLAVVRPSLKRKYKNEESAVELPTISDVPISFQRLGPAHLRLPVNPGDTGQLVFNQRSIDGWKISGGIIDPIDPRKHALSDAVFYPGLYPQNNPIQSNAAQDSVELKLNGSHIEILNNGKFKVTNGTEELFDLLVQTMGKMIEEMQDQGNVDTTNTIFGPQQPNNFQKYVDLKSDYETLKTKLESLKG